MSCVMTCETSVSDLYVSPHSLSCTLAADHGDAPYYPIRLNNGTATSNTTGGQLLHGRVEVYINDTWGTICNYGWGIEDADLACRQLGRCRYTFLSFRVDSWNPVCPCA